MVEKHGDRQLALVRVEQGVTAFNAGDAVAAAVDVCGFPLAPSIRARLGKAAKGLIEAGFPPRIVVTAMVAAVKTGMFGSTETIAQELLTAERGERVSRDRYRQFVAEVSHAVQTKDDPVWEAMRTGKWKEEQA